jgi:hypothetical protein
MNSSTVRYWPSIIPHDCVERRIHFEPLLQAQIEPPTDAVLKHPSRPFAAKNAGRSKSITTTLWQNYCSRTKIFVYRTSEHTAQVEEGDELCPGGT